MTILSTSAGTVAHGSQGSGNPVVLPPSGDHEHHDYDEIRDLLPGRFRSIGVDWPGHGHSPAGTSPSTELRLTQIVEELLDPNARGHRPGVGNSAGGNVAARLAIRRPDVIESGRLPHMTNPAAVAAELTSLAKTMFDAAAE